jgi:hypothetical protein
LVIFLVVAYLLYDRVPGYVNGKSLGYSVAKEAGGLTYLGSADLPLCRRLAAQRQWRCSMDDPSGSSITTYRVTQRDGSCWDGELTGPGRGDGITWDPQISGCVKIGDNVRLLARLYDLI